jgi:hypothetical protein
MTIGAQKSEGRTIILLVSGSGSTINVQLVEVKYEFSVASNSVGSRDVSGSRLSVKRFGGHASGDDRKLGSGTIERLTD